MIYKNFNQIPDHPPRFEVPYSDIIRSVPVGGALQVLTALEHHTARQRKWYRGICLPGLSDWSGDTISYWDELLKKECHGKDLLKVEYWEMQNGEMLARLTIKNVGKKKFTQFIIEILDMAREKTWPMTAPDPDLRTK